MFYKTLVVLALASTTAAAAEAVRIKAAVDAREGPGAYYPVVMRLLPGASVQTLEAREGWNLTDAEKRKGWVPNRALEGASASASGGSLLEKLEQEQKAGAQSRVLSGAEVAAAVRGFARAYVAKRGKGADPSMLEASAFSPDDFQRFSQKRYQQRSRAQCWGAAPLARVGIPRHPDADRLGAAVAVAIAGDGLLRVPALEQYLSQVATLVAESSHAYDLPVRVFILNEQRPLGYASPNGVLFISLGALNLMESEAEFAFFAGHEIAHIVFQHGMARTRSDRQRITEDNAFAEMEGDLGWNERQGDSMMALNEELSAQADEIYEFFRSEKNDAQELEADRWGVIYLARAGYRPEAALSALAHLAQGQVKEADEKLGSKLFWRGTDIAKRNEMVRVTLGGFGSATLVQPDYQADYRAALQMKKGGQP